MAAGSKAPGLSDALARVYKVGPIIWIKRAPRRQRALEGADRRKREIDMDLTPFQFRKNAFYPFDFMQDTACDRAMKLAERMALTACHLTPEALEAGRLKDECSNYGIYAACAGFFGIMFISVKLLPIILVCFGISLILFVVMLPKKQIPKVSAVVVLIEAAIVYSVMR